VFKMRRLLSRGRVVLAITLIWVVMGIIFTIIAILVGNNYMTVRPILTLSIKVYICLTPLILIILSIIRKKHMMLTSILGGIIFLFAIWKLVIIKL